MRYHILPRPHRHSPKTSSPTRTLGTSYLYSRRIDKFRPSTSIHNIHKKEHLNLPIFRHFSTVNNLSLLPAQYPTHLRKGYCAPDSHPGWLLHPTQILHQIDKRDWPQPHSMAYPTLAALCSTRLSPNVSRILQMKSLRVTKCHSCGKKGNWKWLTISICGETTLCAFASICTFLFLLHHGSVFRHCFDTTKSTKFIGRGDMDGWNYIVVFLDLDCCW